MSSLDLPVFLEEIGTNGGCLPMTNEKKLMELIETSLICFLGALVAMLGFLLVWLLFTLAGFMRA